MKYLSPIVRIILFTLLYFPLITHAQQDSIEKQIEDHLKSLPDNRLQLMVNPGSPVSIPDSAKRDIRFNFQKRMALTGHGVLYDIEGREVMLNIEEIIGLQKELLDAIRQEKTSPFEGYTTLDRQVELSEITKHIESALRTNLTTINRFAIMNLLTRVKAASLNDARRSEFTWRSNYLMNRVQRNYKFDQLDLVFTELDGWFQDWWITWVGNRTDYMKQCAAEGVPIPPDFSIHSTDWNFQGQLSTKLTQQGDDANVWTWHEAGQRGACVALPRGTGGPTDLAGIICQSATTGNACFWDNLRRGSATRVQWATETLVIQELQDGSELTENCTNCHQGNNVFLVSPEDPTWCRLLRGQTSPSCSPMEGSDIANFTLAVEAPVNTVNVPNTSIHHSRYTPISGSPARPGWENNETIGCGGACHLGGSAVSTPSPMPPNCGVNCY